MSILWPWILGFILILSLLIIILPLLGSRPQARKGLQDRDYNTEAAGELAINIKPRSPVQVPELPGSYGVDRLALLVRDPNWLYAYWEITATRQEEFSHQFGPKTWAMSKPLLRIYNVTGINNFDGTNANSYMDININEHANNWHINVNSPDCSFCVDYGRMLPDGKFISIIRSNIVTTPRAALSERMDEEWMWIEDIYRSMHNITGISSLLAREKGQQAFIPPGVTSPGFENKY